MVFFAHSRQGYETYLSLGLAATAPLWVTAHDTIAWPPGPCPLPLLGDSAIHLLALQWPQCPGAVHGTTQWTEIAPWLRALPNPWLRRWHPGCAPPPSIKATPNTSVITALFEFTRASARSASKEVSASTDAHAVLLNWSMGRDRSFHPVLDLPNRLVATLTWDERNDAMSRQDLDSWNNRLGISVSSALRMSVGTRQSPAELLAPT